MNASDTLSPPASQVPVEWGMPRSHERLWSAFMVSRTAVAGVLLVLQLLILALGPGGNTLSLMLCGAYLAATIWAQRSLQPFRRPASRGWPWFPTCGVDLVTFALLQTQLHGGLNYTLLFGMPVLMAATLGPQRRALATVAIITLFLLGEASWMVWELAVDATPKLLQTAITGTGYFLMAILAHQLAVRLAREETASDINQLAARTQAAVNEQIIDTLTTGVLVVDPHGNVRTANPSARQLLGDRFGATSARFSLREKTYFAPLMSMIEDTCARHQALTGEILLEPAPDLRHRLRVQTRPTASSGGSDADARQPHHTPLLCVVFLEDLHEIEARVRAEKLASMGRMSVAVAHEIRNPLAAITQANSLLREDLVEAGQQKLSDMVASHTLRLNRIVDDILNVVRVPSQPAIHGAPLIQLDDNVRQSLQEWCGQHLCDDRLLCETGCPTQHVRFDPEHLRRILVNLLDNASRYASQSPGAIRVHTRADTPGWVRLSVWSDGAQLDATIRRHLFEPFFSSESRSSGMGLYLCRELCDRYQAKLDYQRTVLGDRTGNEFFLLIPMATEQPA
jgi:two-component system sensor histidine kinase PilS (NtrC family)